jgi:hypothetical protein
MNWLLTGLLGACLMFLFDPDHGRRRRAVLRDKAFKFSRMAREEADAQVRDKRNRMQGLIYEIRGIHEDIEEEREPRRMRRPNNRAPLGEPESIGARG